MSKRAWKWWWSLLFAWLALPLVIWTANISAARACHESDGGFNSRGQCVGALDGPDADKSERERQEIVEKAENEAKTTGGVRKVTEMSIMLIVGHLVLGGWMLIRKKKTKREDEEWVPVEKMNKKDWEEWQGQKEQDTKEI